MIQPIESEHNRIREELVRKLKDSGQYNHIWVSVTYRRNNINGEVDVLAQRNDGMVQFYEVKVSSARITKAEHQYDRFRKVFKRPSIGYLVSNDFIRRL